MGAYRAGGHRVTAPHEASVVAGGWTRARGSVTSRLARAAPAGALPALRVARSGYGVGRGAPPSATRARRAQRVRSRLRTRLAAFCADALLIHLGFIVAFWLRYEMRLIPADTGEFFDAAFSAYYLAEAVLMVVALTVFARRGLYQLKRTTQWLDEVGTIATGVTVAVAVLVMVFYVFRPGVTLRAMLFYAWLLIIVFLRACGWWGGG